MAHTFTNLLTHLIFSTKDRKPLIDADLSPRLFPYLGGIVRELGGSMLRVNGVADHVHLLVALPAALAIAEAMRIIKGNASRWVHATWPERAHFAWQVGYGAFSVSRSNAEDVSHYIDTQEEHHRRMTFQEEFILFLNRHGLEYDPRYIWE